MVLLKFSIFCVSGNQLPSHISELSKQGAMTMIRVRYISFNSCFRFLYTPCSERQGTFLWRRGVMGYSSLLGAGGQVCAASKVTHF